MKQLLTIKEAAVRVDRAPGRVYAWVASGRLTAHDTRDGLKVRPADVQRVAATMKRGRPRKA